MIQFEIRQDAAGVCGVLAECLQFPRSGARDRAGIEIDDAHVEFLAQKARQIEQCNPGAAGFHSHMSGQRRGGNTHFALQFLAVSGQWKQPENK
jgi:hypothetical protein